MGATRALASCLLIGLVGITFVLADMPEVEGPERMKRSLPNYHDCLPGMNGGEPGPERPGPRPCPLGYRPVYPPGIAIDPTAHTRPIYRPGTRPVDPTAHVRPIYRPGTRPVDPTAHVRPIYQPGTRPDPPSVRPIVDPTGSVYPPGGRPDPPSVRPIVDPTGSVYQPGTRPDPPSVRPIVDPTGSIYPPGGRPDPPSVRPILDPMGTSRRSYAPRRRQCPPWVDEEGWCHIADRRFGGERCRRHYGDRLYREWQANYLASVRRSRVLRTSPMGRPEIPGPGFRCIPING